MKKVLNNKLLRNFLAVGLEDLVRKTMSIAFIVFLAKQLGPAGLGEYAFASTIVMFFVLFQGFGLDRYLIREIAKDEENIASYTNEAVFVRTLSSVIAVLAISIIMLFIPIDQDTKTFTILLMLSALPLAWNTSFAFLALEEMDKHAVIESSGFILFALMSVVTIHYSNSLNSVILVKLIATLFVVFLSVLSLKKVYKPYFKLVAFQRVKELMIKGLPFLMAALAIQLYYSADTVLIQIYLGKESVGFYTAVYKIVLLFIGFTAILQTVIYPRFSKFVKNNDHSRLEILTEILTIFLSISGIYLTSIIIFTGKYLISLLYGASFATPMNIITLDVLSISLLLVFLHTHIGVIMLSHNQEKFYSKATVLAAIVNILINVILLPTFGILGAAIATVTSEVVLTPIMYYSVRNRLGYKPYLQIRLLLKLLILIALTIAFYLIINVYALNLIAILVGYSTIYVVLVLMFELYGGLRLRYLFGKLVSQ